MNRDHPVIFEIASKYCIFHSFVDCEGYSTSSKAFLPTVIDVMVIWIKFTHSGPLSSSCTHLCKWLFSSHLTCFETEMALWLALANKMLSKGHEWLLKLVLTIQSSSWVWHLASQLPHKDVWVILCRKQHGEKRPTEWETKWKKGKALQKTALIHCHILWRRPSWMFSPWLTHQWNSVIWVPRLIRSRAG